MQYTAEEPMVQQRRSQRIRVQFAARYASSNLNLEGLVTDLSPEGLFFSSDYLDGTGEAADVWIDLPSQQATLQLRGEVRWVKDSPHGCGMGIKLIDLSLSDRMLLSGLMSTDSPELGQYVGNA